MLTSPRWHILIWFLGQPCTWHSPWVPSQYFKLNPLPLAGSPWSPVPTAAGAKLNYMPSLHPYVLLCHCLPSICRDPNVAKSAALHSSASSSLQRSGPHHFFLDGIRCLQAGLLSSGPGNPQLLPQGQASSQFPQGLQDPSAHLYLSGDFRYASPQGFRTCCSHL